MCSTLPRHRPPERVEQERKGAGGLGAVLRAGSPGGRPCPSLRDGNRGRPPLQPILALDEPGEEHVPRGPRDRRPAPSAGSRDRARVVSNAIGLSWKMAASAGRPSVTGCPGATRTRRSEPGTRKSSGWTRARTLRTGRPSSSIAYSVAAEKAISVPPALTKSRSAAAPSFSRPPVYRAAARWRSASRRPHAWGARWR